MHARLLLRASFRSFAQAASLGGATQKRLNQQFASVRQAGPPSIAINASETGGSSQSGSRSRKNVLYSAAAVVALTSVAAAKAHQQPLAVGEDQHSSLLDAQWVQRIPQQENVLQVLSAKSMEKHPLLTRDHIVRSVCSSQCGVSQQKRCDISSAFTSCWHHHNVGACSSQPFCGMDSSKTWCAFMILQRRNTTQCCSLAGINSCTPF